MPQVSEVEFNHDAKCYQAIMTDGTIILLEANDLRGAEQEAEQYASQNEYTNFVTRRDWE